MQDAGTDNKEMDEDGVDSGSVAEVDTRPPLPSGLQERFDVGVNLMREGKFQEAEIYWNELTSEFPDYPGPWLNLGLVYFQSQKYALAIENYIKAAQADSEFCSSYSAMGPAFREQGLFQDAEQAYLNAIYCDESDPDSHYNLGILYDLYMQNPVGAVREYKKADELLNGSDEVLQIWIADLTRRFNISEEHVEGPSNQGDTGDSAESPLSEQVEGGSTGEAGSDGFSIEDAGSEKIENGPELIDDVPSIDDIEPLEGDDMLDDVESLEDMSLDDIEPLEGIDSVDNIELIE